MSGLRGCDSVGVVPPTCEGVSSLTTIRENSTWQVCTPPLSSAGSIVAMVDVVNSSAEAAQA